MIKGHLTERAAQFAKRLVPEKAIPDTRSPDEKLASFHEEFESNRIKQARAALRGR